MAYTFFTLSVSDKIATVTINRPDKSNAFTLEMWQELGDVFQAVSERPDARVAILEGAGKNFCAGMDLSAFAAIPGVIASDDDNERAQKLKTFILGLQSGINAIENCKVPVIAAVQRACIGGGINIVSACDMRYCTDDAFFSIKEVDLGIVCDLGALQRMPTFMNGSTVAEMAYTGRSIDGNEAKATGLVAETYDSKEAMMASVKSLAETIAAKPPSIIRGIKSTLLQSRDLTVAEGLDAIATHNSKNLFSDDLAEAMRAYLSKSKPTFKD